MNIHCEQKKWDGMFSINAVGRGLILPQPNVPDFVDFPWKTLPLRRSGQGVCWNAGQEEGCGRELWVKCKVKFKNKLVYIYIYYTLKCK